MVEFFAVAVLALHGLAWSAILILMLFRTSQRRDREWPEVRRLPSAHPAHAVLPILAEHFPEEYDRYRRRGDAKGLSSDTWATCCAILDARAEIEDLCSSSRCS